MADKGYVLTQLNRLASDLRAALTPVFIHVLDELQIGGVSHREKARNFKWIRLDGTTASVANQEFSIQHGLGQAPIAIVAPYVPLDSTGGQMVRLNVTRVADAQRVYLSSPDTDAAISILVET